MPRSDDSSMRDPSLDRIDTAAEIGGRMRLAQQELVPWLVLILALGTLGYLGYLALFASPQTPLLQTHLALITIALLAGVRGILFWRPLPLAAINPFLACIAGLVLANCAAAALANASEYSIFFLALLLVGSGGFILSRTWLTVVSASVWLTYAGLAWCGPMGNAFDLGILALATVLGFSINHLHSQVFHRASQRQMTHQQARQALREALLSAPSSESILVHDHGHVVQANQATATLFGLRPNEVIGREISLFFTIDSWPLVSNSVQLGNLQAIETTGVRKNGNSFPATVFSQPVTIENQGFVVTVIRDISDRRHTELTLDEERQQMAQAVQRQSALLDIERASAQSAPPPSILNQVVQAAAHLLPASLGSCLLLRDEAGQFQVVSSAFRAQPPPADPFRGFKPGAALQWIMDQQESLVISSLESDAFGIRQIFPALDIEAYAGVPIVSAGVISGLLFSFENHPRAFKKEDLDFLNSLAIKASALLAKSHLIQSVDSLSQKLQARRREFEKQIADLTQARDAAEAAGQAKTEFLRRASQELVIALRELRAQIQALRLASLTDEQQQAAEILQSQTAALQNRLAMFVDFGQILAGSLKIQTLDFDLNEVLRNTIRTHLAWAQKKNLELTCHISGPIPRNLRGDAARLEQVLSHLLANALQFTEHGQIELHVTQTQPAPGQVRLRFEVHDTGPGLSPELQETLFASLAPAREFTSPLSPDLKLGLRLCRSLVELMDGQIGVQGRPGSGATFWFTVNLQEASILKST